jgi:two-component system, NarL family, response regulator NreC
MVTRMKREDASPDTCRIVIADDHFLIRQGLRIILEGKDNLQVVGEAGDGMELLFLLDQLNPDLVVLDISMPNLQGIETARLIKMRHPEMNILILTMHQEREYVVAAASAGVEGYLLKEDAQKDLLLAIEKIRHGKGFISPILAKTLEERNELLGGALKFVLNP